MNTQKLENILKNVGDMALKRRARTIIDGLDIQETDALLDAGGGDGYYSKLVREITDAKVTLYDFDDLALKSAERNLQGKSVNIIRGSVEEMPFPDNSFDKIICTEVLEHVPNDDKALGELYRILKPGGRLAITVPNYHFPFLWDPLNWIMQNVFHHPIKKSILNDFFAGIWYGHLRLYEVDNLQKQLYQKNFFIKELRAVTHTSLPFQHYILNIMARLLYGGKMPEELKESVSKFEMNNKVSRPWFISLGFWIFALVDSPNSRTQLSESSVSIYALVTKKEASSQIRQASPSEKSEIIWGEDPELFGPRDYFKNSLVIKELNKYLKSGKILDYGCGSGHLLIRLAKRGYHGLGIDVSLPGLEYFKKKIKEYHLESYLNTIQGDISAVPKDQFDAIILTETLEHIKDDQNDLRSLSKHLKNGGICIITVPAHQELWSKMDEVAGHYRRYNKEELTNVVNNAGLKIERIYYWGFPITYIWHHLVFLPMFMKKAETGKVYTGSKGIIGTILKHPLIIRMLAIPFWLDTLFLKTNRGDGIIAVARKE